MVVYLALCKSEAEARETQNKLIAACSTLVFSRVLHRPHELDAFNADMLRSLDESVVVGQISYEQSHKVGKMRKGIYVASLILVLGLILAIWETVRYATGAEQSWVPVAALWAVELIALAAFAYTSSRALKGSSQGSKKIWKAEQWLRKGRPVVIAGSDDLPDNHKMLPKSILYFDKAA